MGSCGTEHNCNTHTIYEFYYVRLKRMEKKSNILFANEGLGRCTHETCSFFTRRTYFSRRDGRYLVHLVRALSGKVGEFGSNP